MIPEDRSASSVTHNQRAIASEIHAYLLKYGACFATVATLAASVHLSERTVQRNIRRLEAAGVVSTQHIAPGETLPNGVRTPNPRVVYEVDLGLLSPRQMDGVGRGSPRQADEVLGITPRPIDGVTEAPRQPDVVSPSTSPSVKATKQGGPEGHPVNVALEIPELNKSTLLHEEVRAVVVDHHHRSFGNATAWVAPNDVCHVERLLGLGYTCADLHAGLLAAYAHRGDKLRFKPLPYVLNPDLSYFAADIARGQAMLSKSNPTPDAVSSPPSEPLPPISEVARFIDSLPEGPTRTALAHSLRARRCREERIDAPAPHSPPRSPSSEGQERLATGKDLRAMAKALQNRAVVPRPEFV